MKRLTLFITIFLVILCSGCYSKKTLPKPAEIISQTPQIIHPTDTPEVSGTPASADEPSATEHSLTETSHPEPPESHAATTPPTPAETQMHGTDAPPAAETPNPVTPVSTEQPELDSGLKWEDYDLANALMDNKEFLDTYVDTPVNFLIIVLGFDRIVNQIKSIASENVILTNECIPLAGEINDINIAAEYHQSFVIINSRMASCNERTLEVKQSRDIVAFESALNNTVDVLRDYQALLEAFKEEAGG